MLGSLLVAAFGCSACTQKGGFAGMYMCAYVCSKQLPLFHCLLAHLPGTVHWHCSPTHPLLEDLTGCLLSCAALMCRAHVCCTSPTDRQWMLWQVFIVRHNNWDINLEWNAINCDWHTGNRSIVCQHKFACFLSLQMQGGLGGSC